MFASSIDLVVHLDRDIDKDGNIRRQTMEIRSLVPSLHDDFSSQSIFERRSLGGPLEWTGALPSERLVSRIEKTLAPGITVASLLAGRAIL